MSAGLSAGMTAGLIANPVSAFAALDWSMMRIAALLGVIETSANPEAVAVALQKTLGEAVNAYADLVITDEVMSKISAFLLVTYGDQPE